MRVIVPIKQILDPTGFVVNRRRERIFINREEYIINPCDKNALEEALRLKDERGAEVIAISLGEARADDALREALAMGADSAILLSDEILAQADISAAAKALAAAIERIGDYDLILVGQESADTGAGQMGPRLAEALGLAQICEVRQFSVADGKVRAKRPWRGSYIEVEAPLPAVLTIAPDVNKPRYPHGARILNAYREWEVTTWGVADLGLTEEELAPIVEFRGRTFPPPREFGERITGSPEEAARELVQYLASKRLGVLASKR